MPRFSSLPPALVLFLLLALAACGPSRRVGGGSDDDDSADDDDSTADDPFADGEFAGLVEGGISVDGEGAVPCAGEVSLDVVDGVADGIVTCEVPETFTCFALVDEVDVADGAFGLTVTCASDSLSAEGTMEVDGPDALSGEVVGQWVGPDGEGTALIEFAWAAERLLP